MDALGRDEVFGIPGLNHLICLFPGLWLQERKDALGILQQDSSVSLHDHNYLVAAAHAKIFVGRFEVEGVAQNHIEKSTTGPHGRRQKPCRRSLNWHILCPKSNTLSMYRQNRPIMGACPKVVASPLRSAPGILGTCSINCRHSR